MASQGPNIAGAGADDASTGTVAWTSTGSITASDDVRATASLTGAGVTSHYLVSSAHGFTIPTAAVINGISVDVERSSNTATAATIRDAAIRIVKGGTVKTTDKANAVDWIGTESTQTYGGSSDLWGETWTPADINASGFGVAISAVKLTSGTNNARVDLVRITVYYTLAATSTITATATTSAARVIGPRATRTATSTTTANAVRSTARGLAATVTTSASAVPSLAFRLAVTATASSAAAVRRTVGVVRSATGLGSGAVSRLVRRVLRATGTTGATTALLPDTSRHSRAHVSVSATTAVRVDATASNATTTTVTCSS